MEQLSDAERATIEANPLDDALGQFLLPLREADQLQKTTPGADKVRNTVARLLYMLQGQTAAFELRVEPNGPDIGSELATIFARIRNGEFNYDTYRNLVRLVIQKASDVEIWTAVIDIIVTLSRTTPPRTIPSTSQGTPRTHSSAGYRASEETRRQLEPALRQELKNNVYMNVTGFFEKYFEGKKWVKKSDDIYKKLKKRHADGRWVDFPNPPTESDVWQWLSETQEDYFEDAHGVYFTTRSKADLKGSEAQRQLDILVKSRHSTAMPPHDWRDVRVVGEHKKSRTEFMGKFLQLATYVRDVFIAQPTRYFVHAFLLLGDFMELYVFDRSGAFQAKPFNIHSEPQRFMRVLTGYVLMSDEELGLDTVIKQKGKRKLVELNDDFRVESTRLRTKKRAKKTFELEDTPMVIQRGIVCRGTTCYWTKDRKTVVKLSWPSAKRKPEVTHLLAAKQRGVKGVAKPLGHRDGISVAELRKGLIFKRRREITDASEANISGARSGLTGSFGEHSIHEAKRKSQESGLRPIKKSRSSSQASKLSQEVTTEDDSQEEDLQRTPVAASFAAEDEKFRNRVLSCLAVSPAGRPLEDVKTVSDLLRCMRDAVRAHRSLFVDGKILHRDISINNIIMTDPEDADGFHGMLIDLDMATTINENGVNERSGADGMTGTLKYMAIEVVEKAFRDKQRQLDHTYRHDLESFFYVLLDICINHGFSKPKHDLLSKWFIGSYEDVAKEKSGDLGRYFDKLLAKFSPPFDCVKGLAEKLRDVLFEGNRLETGTPKNSSALYDRVLGAFSETLQQIECGDILL